jgi:hypothetical protein
MRDVVEIGGFDPSDVDSLLSASSNGEGMLSLHLHITTFPHPTRSVGFRILAEMVSEELIQNAIYSTHHTLGRVLEFVAELDDRQFPPSYGYFVELEGELGMYSILAPFHTSSFTFDF